MNIRLLPALLMMPLVLAAGPAEAAWRCRNPDLEVGCSGGRCEATVGEGFTPMDIVFAEDGSVDACVYSGCWIGQGQVAGDDRYLSLWLREAEFTPQINEEPVRGELALLLDRQEGVATLMLAAFVQPLVCQRTRTDATG